ncbi:Hsp20/alpha crystallin family protein [Thermocoleostomius sinensis]|jgi:HSP20 family molecular chaperone IbpA|uniref:Hsp20/alpha crystallin family protein n=1 Tax=Thermocoleostomius sinensis A174 TaxID=2016057 RepID=A0A9E8ZHE9_9CYAN|nr:Hsp20/alpha crystallin family protein [Thermocoleostomius sinensis]WAL61812.1 Hsp20/alpha crystallin family protein [Thermocoleostomius sinensis A174]
MANVDAMGSSIVEIQETETTLVVTAQIPAIAAENLGIRVAPNALLLWGEQMERVTIEGYCDFSYPAIEFRKLISLPHAVQPETASIRLQANALVLTFLK